MNENAFRTADGVPVAAVTADEMREVDRAVVEDVGLDILQMMENAGRTLAHHVRAVGGGGVAVLAGNGGNGGGGLACARHLSNRGVSVRVVLDREAGELGGVAERQYRVLDAMGVPATAGDPSDALAAADAIVDALVGYGLRGAARGRAADLIDACNASDAPVVSLDVPSGRDATTGATDGPAVVPDRTVTLALPKTGLVDAPGSLYLADISVPAAVYRALGIDYADPFGDAYWAMLRRA
ncbi:NAD(P)H-hydrate epimerase [Halegenticoccus soli]|uniref:NAD(P)H-hydrate epimerase n=1 Tax=Halegenticoccus soli TaxID=1985678 RepID=UPI000C6D0642|nr:NAD(P)H-hydrate epimerase [Halegenticoccus soli]